MSKTGQMKIVFVGMGAVGGYFGGRMAHAGLDVSFLVRHESATRLKADRLQVKSLLGDFSIKSPRIYTNASEYGEADVVFHSSKAHQVYEAVKFASGLIGSETVVIPLQNGVKSYQAFSGAVRTKHVLGGLCRIFAERIAPGVILHMGGRPSITFGERAGGLSERVKRIQVDLASVGGMKVDASEDIWTEMWIKLLLVCSIGAVGAVTRSPLGIVLSVPQTRELLVAVGDEIAAVGNACGALIPEGFAMQQLENYEKLAPETTASMHRDIERGLPSEFEGQVGAVRRDGQEAGVKTPVLDVIYAALLPGELKAQGLLTFDNVASLRWPDPVSS